MATDYALTSKLKIPVPTLDSRAWLDYLTHWAEINDTMFAALMNKDYVISGLELTTSPESLDFSYDAGSASINSETVDLASGNGTTQPNSFNWVFVQTEQLKISEHPPTGASFAPVACLQTDDDGVVGHADLRINGPIVNGINITPRQVNPTNNINMAAGKRMLHTDANVGSNITMFSNAQIQSILNWGNQAAAIDWTTFDISTLISASAKFVILNCYMATYNADSNGWAVLEVKTNPTDDDNAYNFVDYGHPGASALNGSQIGHANQIILPLTDAKEFEARTLISSLGGSGVYSAFIKIMGYIE